MEVKFTEKREKVQTARKLLSLITNALDLAGEDLGTPFYEIEGEKILFREDGGTIYVSKKYSLGGYTIGSIYEDWRTDDYGSYNESSQIRLTSKDVKFDPIFKKIGHIIEDNMISKKKVVLYLE